MNVSLAISIGIAYLLIMVFLGMIDYKLDKVNRTLKTMNTNNRYSNKPQNIEYR